MICDITSKRRNLSYRILSCFIAVTFISNVVLPPGYAQLAPQTILNLPAPGFMVSPTAGFTPILVKGITIHPENPLQFDFIIDPGQSGLAGEQLRDESTRLIKYFLASLTVPEDELWVNLSPYEKDRIVSETLGQTEMGRDMLAQDYILKQLTASMMYPEKDLGKKFWDRIYKKAQEQFGTTEIPVNTYNKVWIVPAKAVVYQHGNSAFVVESRLKVMLDVDYEASRYNRSDAESRAPGGASSGVRDQAGELKSLVSGDQTQETRDGFNSPEVMQVIREVLIPAIEAEVNTGETFAKLRQIYHSMILAAWYKQNLRQSLLGQVYVNRSKVKGVDVEDKEISQKIYNQYLEAFKKGVYNYIREDHDPATQDIIPRKYFSGGEEFGKFFEQPKNIEVIGDNGIDPSAAQRGQLSGAQVFIAPTNMLEATARNAKIVAEAETAATQREQRSSSPVLTTAERTKLSEKVIANLDTNIITREDHINMIKLLVAIGERDLMAGWDLPGINDDKKRAFLDQVKKVDGSYPGGLRAYKANAQEKLRIVLDGLNPFAGFNPAVPSSNNLIDLDEQFSRLSNEGLKVANKTSFVLVAGGLGERLGYKSGLKVEIPLDLITLKSYLQIFIENILAIQRKSNRLNGEDKAIPLAIMTSDDTHQKTIQFLEANNYFGMNGLSVIDINKDHVRNGPDGKPRVYSLDGREDKGEAGQIIIFKQESVPVVQVDYDAKFLLSADNPYQLQLKPHNHGDIHILMRKSGLAEAWAEEGRVYTTFFQDTNGQVFNAILAGLGESLEKKLKMNFLAVARDPGSNVGALALMALKKGDQIVKKMVKNIEYSDLDRYLRALSRERGDEEKGDVADATGYSPFPGNMNVFILENKTYVEKLNESNGIFAEIVNAKPGTTVTRLESPMQDISEYIPADQVGITTFEPRFAFAAVKNGLKKALEAVEKGIYSESMAPAEAHSFRTRRELFALAGVDINVDGQEKKTLGIPYPDGAKIYVSPDFAQTPEEFKRKISGGSISDRSVVILEGENIRLENSDIDGTFIVRTSPGVHLRIYNLSVINSGWEYVNLSAAQFANHAAEEYLKMRGYDLIKYDATIIDLRGKEPGSYELGPNGEVVQTASSPLTVEKVLTQGSRSIEPLNGAAWVNYLTRIQQIAETPALKELLRLESVRKQLAEEGKTALERVVKISYGIYDLAIFASGQQGKKTQINDTLALLNEEKKIYDALSSFVGAVKGNEDYARNIHILTFLTIWANESRDVPSAVKGIQALQRIVEEGTVAKREDVQTFFKDLNASYGNRSVDELVDIFKDIIFDGSLARGIIPAAAASASSPVAIAPLDVATLRAPASVAEGIAWKKRNEYIFGGGFGYDLRINNAETEWQAAAKLEYALGRTFGGRKYLNKAGRALITADHRATSDAFRLALAQGLADEGVEVTTQNQGDVITTGLPSRKGLADDFDLIIQITGSHNPKEGNGVKILGYKGLPFFGNKLLELSRDIERQEGWSVILEEARINPRDLITEHIQALDDILPELENPVSLVVDFRAGAAGRVFVGLAQKKGYRLIGLDSADAPLPDELFQEEGKPVLVVLNEEPSAEMAAGIWDPSKPEAFDGIKQVQQRIYDDPRFAGRQYAGIVFDGDGDRAGMSDEAGKLVMPERMLIANYQRMILANEKGIRALNKLGHTVKLALDVRASKVIVDVLKKIAEEKGLKIEGEFIAAGFPNHRMFVWEELGKIMELYRSGSLSDEEKNQIMSLMLGYTSAEASGHFFFRVSSLARFLQKKSVVDDGIVSSFVFLHLVDTLNDYEFREGKKLAPSERTVAKVDGLFRKLPVTNEIRLSNAPDDVGKKQALAEEIVRVFAGHHPDLVPMPLDEFFGKIAAARNNPPQRQGWDEPLLLVDGIRVKLTNGVWILLRKSNTSAVIVFKAEADSNEKAGELIRTMKLLKEAMDEVVASNPDFARLKLDDYQKEIQRVASSPIGDKMPQDDEDGIPLKPAFLLVTPAALATVEDGHLEIGHNQTKGLDLDLVDGNITMGYDGQVLVTVNDYLRNGQLVMSHGTDSLIGEFPMVSGQSYYFDKKGNLSIAEGMPDSDGGIFSVTWDGRNKIYFENSEKETLKVNYFFRDASLAVQSGYLNLGKDQREVIVLNFMGEEVNVIYLDGEEPVTITAYQDTANGRKHVTIFYSTGSAPGEVPLEDGASLYFDENGSLAIAEGKPLFAGAFSITRKGDKLIVSSRASSPVSFTKLTIDDIQEFEGKNFMVRVDFNVQMKNGDVVDDARIRASLPLIKEITSKGGKVILTAHLGDPQERKRGIVAVKREQGVPSSLAYEQAEEQVKKEFTLAPIAKRLKQLLAEDNIKVHFNPEYQTPGQEEAAAFITSVVKNGEVLLLENVRFNAAEEILANTEDKLKKAKTDIEKLRAEREIAQAFEAHDRFAEMLFKGVDVFVFDGFGVSHRRHVSVVGAPNLIPRVAGPLARQEVVEIRSILPNLNLAIMGGSKVSDKIKVLKRILALDTVKTVLIGGAMANSFLKAKGYEMGNSFGARVEHAAEVDIARELLSNPKIVIPVDGVIASEFEERAEHRVITFGEEDVPPSWLVVDIGPKTRELYAQKIRSVSVNNSLFWNGPMGAYDKMPDFAADGTKDVAQAAAEAQAYTVVGGGDSAAAVNTFKITGYNYISTGGGASLKLVELPEGEDLPAIAALSPASSPVKGTERAVKLFLESTGRLNFDFQKSLKRLAVEFSSQNLGIARIQASEIYKVMNDSFQPSRPEDYQAISRIREVLRQRILKFHLPLGSHEMNAEKVAALQNRFRDYQEEVDNLAEIVRRGRIQDIFSFFDPQTESFKVPVDRKTSASSPVKLETISWLLDEIKRQESTPADERVIRNGRYTSVLTVSEIVGKWARDSSVDTVLRSLEELGANVLERTDEGGWRISLPDRDALLKARGPSKKILVVDTRNGSNLAPDNSPARILQRRVNDGYIILPVSSVEKGLEKLKNERVDLLVTDVKEAEEIGLSYPQFPTIVSLNGKSPEEVKGVKVVGAYPRGFIEQSLIREVDKFFEEKNILLAPATENALPPGGIDLNPALLDLQIRRDANFVPLPLPQQPLGEMHIEGFIPVIINITPVTNLPLLLGLADTKQDTDETRPAMKAREMEEISALN